MYEGTLKTLLEKCLKELNIDKETANLKVEKLDSTTMWHPDFRISMTKPHVYVTIKGMPSGCGLVMIHNFTESTFDEITAKIFQVVADYYKGDGAGTIIASLGCLYNRNLEVWGFKQLVEYPNFRHNAPATQRLFIKIAER